MKPVEGESHKTQGEPPDIEAAYEIMKKRKEGISSKDLLIRVMDEKGVNEDERPARMAHLHTELSLDPRFVHIGGRKWGLREWVKSGSGKHAASPKVSREVPGRPKAKLVRLREEMNLEPSQDEPVAMHEEEEEGVFEDKGDSDWE
jgi:DNA-directed RNA polymerase subunit delta